PTWPCALTPAAVSLSTAVATAALASSAVSSVRTTPVLVAISRSRKCSTHTSPLDSRARSRAASRARSDASEWSTATRILSYIALASLDETLLFPAQVSYGTNPATRDERAAGTGTFVTGHGPSHAVLADEGEPSGAMLRRCRAS